MASATPPHTNISEHNGSTGARFSALVLQCQSPEVPNSGSPPQHSDAHPGRTRSALSHDVLERHEGQPLRSLTSLINPNGAPPRLDEQPPPLPRNRSWSAKLPAVLSRMLGRSQSYSLEDRQRTPHTPAPLVVGQISLEKSPDHPSAFLHATSRLGMCRPFVSLNPTEAALLKARLDRGDVTLRSVAECVVAIEHIKSHSTQLCEAIQACAHHFLSDADIAHSRSGLGLLQMAGVDIILEHLHAKPDRITEFACIADALKARQFWWVEKALGEGQTIPDALFAEAMRHPTSPLAEFSRWNRYRVVNAQNETLLRAALRAGDVAAALRHVDAGALVTLSVMTRAKECHAWVFLLGLMARAESSGWPDKIKKHLHGCLRESGQGVDSDHCTLIMRALASDHTDFAMELMALPNAQIFPAMPVTSVSSIVQDIARRTLAHFETTKTLTVDLLAQLARSRLLPASVAFLALNKLFVKKPGPPMPPNFFAQDLGYWSHVDWEMFAEQFQTGAGAGASSTDSKSEWRRSWPLPATLRARMDAVVGTSVLSSALLPDRAARIAWLDAHRRRSTVVTSVTVPPLTGSVAESIASQDQRYLQSLNVMCTQRAYAWWGPIQVTDGLLDDFGGIFKNWMTHCARALLNPQQGFFTAIDDLGARVAPNPEATTPDQLARLRCAGQLLARALVEHLPVLTDRDIPRAVFSLLLGRDYDIDDLMDWDPSWKATLLVLRAGRDGTSMPAGIDDDVERAVIDALVDSNHLPSGTVKLTPELARAAIAAFAQARLPNMFSQSIREFLRGFYDVVPYAHIVQWTVDDVVAMLRGQLDIAVLRRPYDAATNMGTMYYSTAQNNALPHQDAMNFFWDTLAAWAPEDQRKFYKGVTGVTAVPAQGFRGREGRPMATMAIEFTQQDVRVLPRSNTCFNQLHLHGFYAYPHAGTPAEIDAWKAKVCANLALFRDHADDGFHVL